MLDDDDLGPDPDLRDRLLHVENSLLLLKAKSRYFADWDNSEVERLEGLRRRLARRFERMPGAPAASRDDAAREGAERPARPVPVPGLSRRA
jgi:hypothetical protein